MNRVANARETLFRFFTIDLKSELTLPLSTTEENVGLSSGRMLTPLPDDTDGLHVSVNTENSLTLEASHGAANNEPEETGV